LAEGDCAYCRTCTKLQRQFKKIGIWTLPPVLIVHLKRFGRDYNDGPLTKIRTSVDLPLELDISEYVCDPGTTETVFDLYAVVNHHGGVGGGHYTAHAMVTTTADEGSEEGKWFKFNDSAVSAASVEDLDEAAAYVLFYRQRRS